MNKQNYQEADWQEILNMWKTYNLFICGVIENISDEKLLHMTPEHNYNDMGWGKNKDNFPKQGEPSNLAFLIEDYIGHLEHHVSQIKSISQTS